MSKKVDMLNQMILLLSSMKEAAETSPLKSKKWIASLPKMQRKLIEVYLSSKEIPKKKKSNLDTPEVEGLRIRKGQKLYTAHKKVMIGKIKKVGKRSIVIMEKGGQEIKLSSNEFFATYTAAKQHWILKTNFNWQA